MIRRTISFGQARLTFRKRSQDQKVVAFAVSICIIDEIKMGLHRKFSIWLRVNMMPLFTECWGHSKKLVSIYHIPYFAKNDSRRTLCLVGILQVISLLMLSRITTEKSINQKRTVFRKKVKTQIPTNSKTWQFEQDFNHDVRECFR